MYVLGIDGGGTKTTAIVADKYGNVYMQAETGRSNPNTLSKHDFEEVMCGVIRQLKHERPDIFEEIKVCFAGMAGVGESGRDIEVANLLRTVLPAKTQIHIKNDAFNALYAGTLGAPGIVQIAGTGAITFGMNEEQKMVRSGGWGYLFDDEGSGFHLGNEGLRAVFKAYDQRGPATTLTHRLLEYFDVMKVPDIIGRIYGKEHPRSVIAPLAKIVVKEATAGDESAKRIVIQACEAMMTSMLACHNQLFEKNHPTIIVLSGGVFTNSDLFIDNFNKLAWPVLPNATFQKNVVSPVGGSIVAGLMTQHILPAEGFAKRLNEQVKSEVTG